MLEACFAYNDLRRRRPGDDLFTPGQKIDMTLRGGAGDAAETEAAERRAGLPDGVPLSQLGHVLTLPFQQARANAVTTLATPLRDHQLPGGALQLGDGDLWLPMYGYAGIVWFKLQSLESFLDAVSRLLMLGDRTFGLDGGSGKAYRLYLLPRADTFSSDVAQNEYLDQGYYVEVNCQGRNSYGADCAVWQQVVLRLIGGDALVGEGEDSDSIDVSRVRVEAYRLAIFVSDLYEPFPWMWEPPETSDKILKLMREAGAQDWRPDVAYIRRPENVSTLKAWCWNTLGHDLARAMRILSPGRIAGRPGSPAIPNCVYSFAGWDSRERTWAFGGLCPPSRMIRKLLEHDPANPVLVVKDDPGARHRASVPPEGWFYVFAPGSYRRSRANYQSWSIVDNVEQLRPGIRAAMAAAVGPAGLDKEVRVEIFSPGTKAFMADEVIRSSAEDESKTVNTILLANDTDLEWGKLQALLRHRRDYLVNKVRETIGAADDGTILTWFPLLVTVRPIFEEYSLFWGPDKHRRATWNPNTMSLRDLRALIMSLIPNDEKQAAQNKCFHLRADARPPRAELGGEDLMNFAPGFIVKPDMCEYDWDCVRSLITYSEAVVTSGDPSDFCPQYDDSDSSAPFGVRNTSDQQPQLLWKDPNTTANVWNPERDDTAPYRRGVKRLHDVHRELRQKTERSRDTNVRGTDEYVSKLPRRPAKEPLTDAYKGRLRKAAYTKPQSVYQENDLPLHGPAMESSISTGSNSIPLVTTAVLTPTEGHQLQKDFHDLRNENLNRTQRCPFPGCDVVFPTEPQWQHSTLSTHVLYAHRADKCNFCDELLYHDWTPEQRRKHYNDKHLREMTAGHQLEDQNIAMPYQYRPTTGEAERNDWQFCPRCGRNHHELNKPADRNHHDGVCYRHSTSETPGQWCTHCGQRTSASTAADHLNGACLRASHFNTMPQPPFCITCGMSLGAFSTTYRSTHTHECKPIGTGQVIFCPFCGRDLKSLTSPAGHVAGCSRKPATGAVLPDEEDYKPPRRKRGRPSAASALAEAEASRAAKRTRTSARTDADFRYVSLLRGERKKFMADNGSRAMGIPGVTVEGFNAWLEPVNHNARPLWYQRLVAGLPLTGEGDGQGDGQGAGQGAGQGDGQGEQQTGNQTQGSARKVQIVSGSSGRRTRERDIRGIRTTSVKG